MSERLLLSTQPLLPLHSDQCRSALCITTHGDANVALTTKADVVFARWWMASLKQAPSPSLCMLISMQRWHEKRVGLGGEGVYWKNAAFEDALEKCSAVKWHHLGANSLRAACSDLTQRNGDGRVYFTSLSHFILETYWCFDPKPYPDTCCFPFF